MGWGTNKHKRTCPNCVSVMVNQIKNNERVYVCRECGVVEQADEPQESQIIKIKKDETDNGTEPFYDCSEENLIYHYIQQKDPS